MTSNILRYILWGACATLLVILCPKSSLAQEEEKTYAISLEKTAEIGKEIHEVEDKKVLSETHVVRKGEHIWKIFREKGLLEKRNLYQLLSILKKLNTSLTNLDLIHPGEKIIIPLKISPVAGEPFREAAFPEKTTPLAGLKDLSFENYSVKPGDSIIRVATGKYDIPSEDAYNEYLELVKKLNPSVKDVDLIYPGQVIRLPIYSPEIVRKPIEAAMSTETGVASQEGSAEQKPSSLAPDLGIIFTEMGEEWVHTGEHFIPLKSGGQMDLKAKSFPIINLRNGLRVIVDLNDKLPDKMASFIESSWANYRIIHLEEEDDLMAALEKILSVCNYPRVLKKGEPLGLKGDIIFEITGDWIVTLSETSSDKLPNVVVINLKDSASPDCPRTIKNYLKGLGVKIIDYPSKDDDYAEEEIKILEGGADPSSLVETVLNLIDRDFSTQVEIPAYQSQKAGLKLTIKADFFLKIDGKDAIIDLSGLGPDVISFLKEHNFLVLSLATENEPLSVLAKTFEFLGMEFDRGPHSFMVTPGDESRNIRMSLSGIVFLDPHGKTVLATPVSLPGDVASFLSKRGYTILPLSFF